MLRQQHFAHVSGVFSQVSRYSMVLAACLIWISLPGHSAQLESLQEPVAAPALTLPDIRDRVHDLASYRGRVVLVNFWATWCPPCLLEMPALQRLARRFQGQPFSLLAVNVGEGKSAIYRFSKLGDLNATVLHDSDAQTFNRWGATVYPSSYLIDRSGRIRFVAEGALDWDSAAGIAAVETLLTEDTVVPRTRLVSPCYGHPSRRNLECAP